uniref:Putative la rna-binding domain of la-related protein 3 n=1 Tax=Tabanus bromius TaxID=304241 RepID=A0A0K8TR23_TABBR
MTDVKETDQPQNNTEEQKKEKAEEVEKSGEEEKTEEVKKTEDADKTEDSEKLDESAEGPEPSKQEKEIIRQIEYYFGDANLHRDKFLLQQIEKDEGWVPFEVLLTFKRLASLSKEPEVIVKALEKSDEGLIEISEDKTKIRRHPERPLPEHNEERRKEISSRTAYAKGFPLDAEMSDLIEFFSPFEKVLNINMRKYHDKRTKTYKFKGSVFVTFAKKEQCQEFIEKEKVEYKGVELLRKWQEQYLEEKKKSPNKKKGGKAKAEEKAFELPKGTVLQFEGTDENTTRELIKEELSKFEENIAFLEYNKGDSTGYVRLQNENSAKPLLEKLTDSKLKVGDAELVFKTLTEEEEKSFLEKAVEHMKSKRNHQSRHKGGNRKRRNVDSEESEPATKVKAN